MDVLAIAEAKLDDTFVTSRFLFDGFHPLFRHDRNKHGWDPRICKKWNSS